MTITLRGKHTDKAIVITDVTSITPDVKCLGVTGFDIHYTDGTFNVYSNKSWDLVSVNI